jgi:hypothetical protein
MNGRSVASETQTEAKEILQEWSAGDEGAPARLMPLVYQELRRRAAEYLRHERADHTLRCCDPRLTSCCGQAFCISR